MYFTMTAKFSNHISANYTSFIDGNDILFFETVFLTFETAYN